MKRIRGHTLKNSQLPKEKAVLLLNQILDDLHLERDLSLIHIQMCIRDSLYIEGIGCDKCREKIRAALTALEHVTDVVFKEEFTEVFLEQDVPDTVLKKAAEGCGEYVVTRID